jgi:tetratricopeptide (TPR) repeat protein
MGSGSSAKAREKLDKAAQLGREVADLGNLAQREAATGNYDRQKKVLDKALKVQERAYGEYNLDDHYEVSQTYERLAGAYDNLYAELKELLSNSSNLSGAQTELLRKRCDFGLRQQVVPPKLREPDVETAERLVDVYLLRRRELLEKALKIQEKHYGRHHHQVGIACYNLGMALSEFDDVDSSKRQYAVLSRALKIKEGFYGSCHPEIDKIHFALGQANEAMGDSNASRQHFMTSLEIRRQLYGYDHSLTLDVQSAIDQAENTIRQSWHNRSSFSSLVSQRESVRHSTHSAAPGLVSEA